MVFFFGGVRDLNPGPCIYYTLSLLPELSSRGGIMVVITQHKQDVLAFLI